MFGSMLTTFIIFYHLLIILLQHSFIMRVILLLEDCVIFHQPLCILGWAPELDLYYFNRVVYYIDNQINTINSVII